MNVGVCSDVGKIRGINQDSFLCSELEELPLFVVADGMGGHKAGEVASLDAVKIIKDIFYEKKDELLSGKLEVIKFIIDTIKAANEKVYSESLEHEEYRGMGTTITLALILDGFVYIGHIGDSRAYLLRDNKLVQLTQDHSLVAELVRNGTISEEDAINHPQKNVITRALGTQKNIRIDIIDKEVKKNDLILLCTDGLTNMVKEDKIKQILLNSDNLQEACNKLTKRANESGGLDNITMILLEVE